MPEKTLSLSRWGIVADDMSSNGIMFCCTGTWLFTPMALSAAKDPGLLANTLSLLMVASMSWRATFRRGATAAFLSARVGAREPSLAAARCGCAAEATVENIFTYAEGWVRPESPAAARRRRVLRRWMSFERDICPGLGGQEAVCITCVLFGIARQNSHFSVTTLHVPFRMK